jgi:hypothetical protein
MVQNRRRQQTKCRWVCSHRRLRPRPPIDEILKSLGAEKRRRGHGRIYIGVVLKESARKESESKSRAHVISTITSYLPEMEAQGAPACC